MRPLFFVKDTAGDVACEQALCLGEKNHEEREGKGRGPGQRGLFAFPSPQFPTRLKAFSQTTGDVS